MITLLTIGAGSALASYTAAVRGTTLRITGDAASDKLALEIVLSDPTLLLVDVGDDGTPDFQFPLASFTAIYIQAGAGNDQVRIGGGFADKAVTSSVAPATISCSAARRTTGYSATMATTSSSAVEATTPSRLGTGTDTVVWNPGDGSDRVDGDDDTLDFNGSNAGEKYDIAANGRRVRLSRDIGNVTMDLCGITNVTCGRSAAPTASPWAI